MGSDDDGEAIEFGLARCRHTAVFGFRFRSRTCASRLLITSTAMLSTPSFVCGLSFLFGFSIMQTRPSSLRASLMSLILILSLALLLNLRPTPFPSSSSPASLPFSLSVFFLLPPLLPRPSSLFPHTKKLDYNSQKGRLFESMFPTFPCPPY